MDKNKIKKDIKYYETEMEKYKRILDRMSESVWVWDENERTVYANPNFCNLLWYKLEEMLWRESYDFWDEESTRTVKENNEFRKQWDKSKYEWVLKAKDGTLIPVFLSWTPIPWGWTVWIMTDLRPIKSLQKVEKELLNLNKQKDEIISIIWHEFRTPLTTIKGYLSLILEEENVKNLDSESMKTFLLHVYKNANHLTKMLNDILRLSANQNQKTVMNFELINIWEIIDFVEKNEKLEADIKWVKLKVYISEQLKQTKIKVDKEKFIQILSNLVSNWIKFNIDWWIVELSVKEFEWKIRFSIKDTGVWIPFEKQEMIFEKFKQLESVVDRNKAEWLWLWLSIVKEFIEKHNSKIYVQSNFWMGSTFYFDIPFEQ